MLLILLTVMTVFVSLNLYVLGASKAYILTTSPTALFPVGIVPGAGLNRDKTPSLALQDRLDKAVHFYKKGLVQKLLLSGDNSSIYYDEPTAMRNYLIEAGVAPENIVLDFAGRRTYDTCYRAKHIFQADKVIIFTQAYHLYRAVYLCRELGLDAYGIAVEQSEYIQSRYRYWLFREFFARILAVWDINIARPVPVLGDIEPISTNP